MAISHKKVVFGDEIIYELPSPNSSHGAPSPDKAAPRTIPKPEPGNWEPQAPQGFGDSPADLGDS